MYWVAAIETALLTVGGTVTLLYLGLSRPPLNVDLRDLPEAPSIGDEAEGWLRSQV